MFDKLIQILRFGCSCSATTIRNRRDVWIAAVMFARLKQIAPDARYTRTPSHWVVRGRDHHHQGPRRV